MKTILWIDSDLSWENPSQYLTPIFPEVSFVYTKNLKMAYEVINEKEIDLIVMDVFISEKQGMTPNFCGMALIGLDIPKIIVTAQRYNKFAGSTVNEWGEKHGVKFWVDKPYTDEEMAQTIKNGLASLEPEKEKTESELALLSEEVFEFVMQELRQALRERMEKEGLL